MSIGAIGASGSGTLNQILASLLSRIDNSQDSSTTSTQPTDSSFTPDTGSSPCNALTGSSTAGLSGDVLGVLLGLQQQSGASQTAASGQTSAAGSSNPLDQLFSAMDSDGDGSVSQTEMENYLEQQGATQSQADGLYAMLDQNGSNGVSESQMADALQQSGAVHRGGGQHHHHHGASGASSSDGADALLQAMDANDDGSVDQTEFTDFVTQNGGTADEANQDFAALDTSNSGTLSSSDFASAIEQLQSSMNNGSYSPVVSILNAFAQNTTAASTNSVTA